MTEQQDFRDFLENIRASIENAYSEDLFGDPVHKPINDEAAYVMRKMSRAVIAHVAPALFDYLTADRDRLVKEVEAYADQFDDGMWSGREHIDHIINLIKGV